MNKTQGEEIYEAINSGNSVLRQIDVVDGYLCSAENWGWFDLFSRGSIISTLFKHSKLDDAEQQLYVLKGLVSNFNRELSDVKVMDNIESVGIDSGLKFADWFFDGILVDSIVLSEISDSRRKLQDLKVQVQNILSDLNRVFMCNKEE